MLSRFFVSIGLLSIAAGCGLVTVDKESADRQVRSTEHDGARLSLIPPVDPASFSPNCAIVPAPMRSFVDATGPVAAWLSTVASGEMRGINPNQACDPAASHCLTTTDHPSTSNAFLEVAVAKAKLPGTVVSLPVKVISFPSGAALAAGELCAPNDPSQGYCRADAMFDELMRDVRQYKGTHNVRVNIAAAKYVFSAPATKPALRRPSIDLSGLSDVTIAGTQTAGMRTRLVIANPFQPAIKISQSSRVRVSGLEIDYDFSHSYEALDVSERSLWTKSPYIASFFYGKMLPGPDPVVEVMGLPALPAKDAPGIKSVFTLNFEEVAGGPTLPNAGAPEWFVDDFGLIKILPDGVDLNGNGAISDSEQTLMPTIDIGTSTNKLDFVTSAGIAVAVVPPGRYLTPQKLALAVSEAMNVAAPAAAITVSYDVRYGKFTMASASGGFGLLWGTGDHSAESIGPKLGFSQADMVDPTTSSYTSGPIQFLNQPALFYHPLLAAFAVPDTTPPMTVALARRRESYANAIDVASPVYSGPSATPLSGNEDITIEGIKLFSYPQMGFGVRGGRRIKLVGNSVSVHAGRLTSGRADSIHIAGAVDVEMAGNVVRGQGDDGLNVRGIDSRVLNLQSSTCSRGSAQFQTIEATLDPEAWEPNYFGVGDYVVLLDNQNAPLVSAAIDEVQYVSGRVASIRMLLGATCNADCVARIMAQASAKSANLPHKASLMNLTKSGRFYLHSANRFQFSGGRGAIVQAPNGVVKDNFFSYVQNSSLRLYADNTHSFTDGPGASNVYVVGNDVRRSNFYGLGPQMFRGAIFIGNEDDEAEGEGLAKLANFPLIQNVVLRNNAVEQVGYAAAVVSRARHVEVSDTDAQDTKQYRDCFLAGEIEGDEWDGSPGTLTPTFGVRKSSRVLIEVDPLNVANCGD